MPFCRTPRPFWMALAVLLSMVISESALAKKDFRGLFGSYRRERFTENEAQDSDFGVDLLLSTLLPISGMAASTEDANVAPKNLNYATFFNFEASLFYTLSYNWEFNFNIGSYSYETRKQNSVGDLSQNALPLFHQFEFSAIPVMLGVKHRFSREDLVPYVGLAGGVAFVKRRGFYDYSQEFNEEKATALVAQLNVGMEFYFASRAGIRLEAGAMYFQLPEKEFRTNGSPVNLPYITYKANPLSVRYASGVFFLF